MSNSSNEAEKFFLDIRAYFDGVLSRYPERKVPWWHRLFHVEPEWAFSEHVVLACDFALTVIVKPENDLPSLLCKVIAWQEWERDFSGLIDRAAARAKIPPVDFTRHLKEVLDSLHDGLE